MITKQAEENIEKEIIHNERLLQKEQQSFEAINIKFVLNDFSDKDQSRLIKRQAKIQQKLKALQSEQSLFKYSPYIKMDYNHNLSALMGLIHRYINFIQKLEYKKKFKH